MWGGERRNDQKIIRRILDPRIVKLDNQKVKEPLKVRQSENRKFQELNLNWRFDHLKSLNGMIMKFERNIFYLERNLEISRFIHGDGKRTFFATKRNENSEIVRTYSNTLLTYRTQLWLLSLVQPYAALFSR